MGRMTISNGANSKSKGTVKKGSYAPGLAGFNQQIAKIPAFVPPKIPQFNYTRPTQAAYQGLPSPAQYAPSPAPIYNGGGGSYSGGGGGASFAPAPAPKPPRMSDDDWLAGDSEFQSQQNEFTRAMTEFRNRINRKKKEFGEDYDNSKRVTGQNQQLSMAGLGEDFAARGMASSGLFDSSRTQLEDQFKNQLANILTVRDRQNANADNDLADYSREIELSKGNARRNALARFANQQALLGG